MIKNYCDGCGKEVEHRNCADVRIIFHKLGVTKLDVIKSDVCPEYVDRVKLVIQK